MSYTALTGRLSDQWKHEIERALVLRKLASLPISEGFLYIFLPEFAVLVVLFANLAVETFMQRVPMCTDIRHSFVIFHLLYRAAMTKKSGGCIYPQNFFLAVSLPLEAVFRKHNTSILLTQ